MRGPQAPGVRLGAGLKTCGGPNPRGRSPLFIFGFYDTAGEVLLKREPTGSLGVRGNPGGVFASFCRYELKLGQKEVAAQSISFLGRIAFFMRGHIATKVWPAGHLLSSHEERRQRRAKGVPPLGIPKQLAGFLFRKAGGRADAQTRLYTKKGCGPGLGWL